MDNNTNLNCMNDCISAEIELMFGTEGKPQPCIKFPISIDAALIALLFNEAESQMK